MWKFLGNKVNKYIISSKTANFEAKILNLVIFFRSSEFFCESSDFCREACASTGFLVVDLYSWVLVQVEIAYFV